MSPTSLQLQNSKAVIQSKDSTIQELKEKIAYLEAEVRALGSLGREQAPKEKTGHEPGRGSGGQGPQLVPLLLRSEYLGWLVDLQFS